MTLAYIIIGILWYVLNFNMIIENYSIFLLFGWKAHFYNIERMLRSVLKRGGKVKACGGCSEARGISDMKLVEGVEISNMKEFSGWVVDSDKVLTF